MDIRSDLLKATHLLSAVRDAPPREWTWRLVVVHGLLQDIEQALRREIAEGWEDAPTQHDQFPERPSGSE